MNLFKRTKDILWTSKVWLLRLFIYPQKTIVPGEHFNYDEYWKVKRKGNMGSLGSWQKKRAKLASEIIKKSGGKSVNDIGSGAGELLKVIKDFVPLDKAIAYDSSQYALDAAKSFGLETKLFDINKTGEFQNINESDFTIMFEILEHIPGPEELLKETFDKSRKGVLFSIPNTGFIIHRLRLFLFGKFPLQWQKHPGEHLRFWTNTDLKWWLKAQGYKNYKIHYYVGIPIFKKIWPNLFCAGLFVELKKC
jgi:SAM-dependent methyltransferase